MKKILMASTFLCGLTQLHGVARAQNTLPDQPAPRDAQATDTKGQIEEIIVTARRREENTQKTSLAISVITPNTLARAGVASAENLNSVVPGITIAQAGPTTQTYIRGVGNYSAVTYAESAIAYNMDGAYISRPWAISGNLFDLQRVEVLKGPQGTLYGRNASGGAVNLISNRPSFTPEANLAAEYGNYNGLKLDGSVNLPLSTTLAIRGAFQLTQHDGYLSDGYDADRSRNGRLRLLWEPSSDVSLLISGSYSHLYGQGAGSTPLPPINGNKWLGVASLEVNAIYDAQPGIGPLLASPNSNAGYDAKIWSISAEFNWNFGFATLTILPAYRKGDLQSGNWVAGFLYQTDESSKQTSVEARLAGDTDKLKWVAGLYYFNEDQAQPLQFVDQGIQQTITNNFKTNTESYAAFGEATWNLTDRVRLIGGLRYTHEAKVQSGTNVLYTLPNAVTHLCNPPYSFGTPPTGAPALRCQFTHTLPGDVTYSSTTWRAGTEFDLAEHSMAYFTVSTGFKSGGFYSAPAPSNTFKPEKLTAFDLGIRNRFLDNRLQVNLEAFYWKYDNHQESHLGPTSAGNLTFVTENAGSATLYGADLDIRFSPTPVDKFNFSVEYLHSKYDEFVYNYPSAFVGPPNTTCAASAAPPFSTRIDCSGNQLVRAPKWVMSAGYERRFELGSGGAIVANVQTQISSPYWLAIDFLPSERTDWFTRTDLNLTYEAPNGRWSIGAFVRNLENDTVYTKAALYPFVNKANPLLPAGSFVLASVRPPRTYGARASVKF